jgi:cytochrome b subunit of formate dehydrogenase
MRELGGQRTTRTGGNRSRLHPPLLGVAIVGLVLMVGVRIAPAASPSNADCLACHSDKDLKAEVGGQSVSLFVDATQLKGSVHAGLQCTDCHAGIQAIPHAEKLPPVACKTCHGDAASAFARSLHGRPGGPQLDCWVCHGTHAIQPAATLGIVPCRQCHAPTVVAYLDSVHGRAVAKGIKEAAVCTDCHGKLHTLLPVSDPNAPTNRKNMAATCGRCHGNKILMERLQIPIPQAYQLYSQSVHSRAVAEGLPAATCNNCHRAHDILPPENPRSSINRQHIPETCGACHEQPAHRYLDSIHGTAMRQGVSEAPDCNDCHGEHRILAAQNPESPVSARQITKTCASCHGVTRIVQKFNIPSNRVETYYNTYHGLAAQGGSTVAANCASCHGNHLILPPTDPRSSINKANLPATCGKCHPGAGATFAEGPVHLSLSAQHEPILYYLRQFYLLLIFCTIGGMLLHNGLDFGRKLRRDYRRRGGSAGSLAAGEYADHEWGAQRWLPRMTAAERWQHGLLFVAFSVLVYTGFALKFPDTWLFRWFTALENGYAIRGWTHRGAGVVLILAGLWHLGYLPTRQGRAYLLDMLPRYQDVKEAVQNVLYLAGLCAESPRFDRFSYIEKVEYWALIWGSAVMITTGLLLWFVNITLRVFPLWVVDLLTLIHYYEAWLATLAILVWHFYFVIFNPDVYPMNWSWLTGLIPEETLRHEHPREYERLLAGGPREAAPSEAPRPDEPEGPAPSSGT